MIAQRYQDLVTPYFEVSSIDPILRRLYGLSVEFSPPESQEPRWGVINFEIEKELGTLKGYPYFRSF
jgi:hypothetical protein